MTMSRPRATLICAVLALISVVSAQSIVPSNDTSEIPSYESYPRFWVNGSDFSSFHVVPLGWYSQISQQTFLGIEIQGRLTIVTDNNANSLIASAIDYISCDPEDYPGVLGAVDVLRTVSNNQQGNSVILYSKRSQHCDTSGLREIAPANGIFTTIEPNLAGTVSQQIQNATEGSPAVLVPDANSYTNPSSNTSGNQGYSGGSGSRPGPTTAVAMIILYTITGLITALFVIIIVTGAVRAHRHPERYGPSNVAGRPRRSRAKGIARAMLDTIPIVKFGEKEEPMPKEVDIEMTPAAKAASTDTSKTTSDIAEESDKSASGAVADSKTTNPDGTDEEGQLGCSICTEDFNKGEEVRVLPCNHKFHPECVDPWLLNVSGTCPLCRIDLRPKEEQQQARSSTDTDPSASSARDPTSPAARRSSAYDMVAPPLGHLPIRLDRATNTGRRDTATFATLRSAAGASREDRIAALRRFRQQRRSQGETVAGAATEQEEERRGLSTRLRERFRVRTRRQGEEDVAGEARPVTARRMSSNAVRNSYAV